MINKTYNIHENTKRLLGINEDDNIIWPDIRYSPIDKLVVALIYNGPILHSTLNKFFSVFGIKGSLPRSLKRLESDFMIYSKIVNNQKVWCHSIGTMKLLDLNSTKKYKRPEIHKTLLTEYQVRGELFVDNIIRSRISNFAPKILNRPDFNDFIKRQYVKKFFEFETNKPKRNFLSKLNLSKKDYDFVFPIQKTARNSKKYPQVIEIMAANVSDDDSDFLIFLDEMKSLLKSQDIKTLQMIIDCQNNPKLERIITSAIIDFGFGLKCWQDYIYTKYDELDKMKAYDQNNNIIKSGGILLIKYRNTAPADFLREIQDSITAARNRNVKLKDFMAYTDTFNNQRPFTLEGLIQNKILFKNVDDEKHVINFVVLDTGITTLDATKVYDKIALCHSFASTFTRDSGNWVTSVEIISTTQERTDANKKFIEKVLNTDISDKRPRLSNYINGKGIQNTATAKFLNLKKEDE